MLLYWVFQPPGIILSLVMGLGGTSKRMTDLAVRQHKCEIQDPMEFYQWGNNFHRGVTYIYADSEYISEIRTQVEDMNKAVLPLKGTMKVHAICAVSRGVVRFRDTACYCERCLSAEYDEVWVVSSILKSVPRTESPVQTTCTAPPHRDDESMPPLSDATVSTDDVSVPTVPDVSVPTLQGVETENETAIVPPESIYEVGVYVAVVYQGRCYIGLVQ